METNLQGILCKAIAGFYYVEAGGCIFECKARGIFRKEKITPTVGDCVIIEPDENGKGLLTEILPRKNCLVRPPIANIDRLFIVSAENTPSPNALMIDRLTAIAVRNNIEPIVVFNKSDMGDLSSWQQCYEKAGFKSIITSAVTGQGLDEVRAYMQGCCSAFTGNSGVGKSSLLNAIIPNFRLETGEVSEKLGRGRHTTRKVELFHIGDCFVADTPGFSSLDIEKTMRLLKTELPEAFPEFEKYYGQCRFTSCAHIGEKGCAVCAAVAAGEISESRYQSYKTIYEQIKDLKEWELK